MTRAGTLLSHLSRDSFVVPLACAFDEAHCGGKASALARALHHGMPVPNGFVLTRAALDLHLSRAGVCESDSHIGRALLIRNRILATPLPADVAQSLDRVAGSVLGHGVVAVRSSAVGEDGRDASFAGQFESVLGVNSRAALEEAVRRSWASCWSDRAVAYRQAHGMHAQGMAILIQVQVAAAAAGVLFTRHPDPAAGDDDRMLAEYCGGLADRLVAGQVDPARLELSRATRRVTSHLSSGEEPDPRVERLVTGHGPDLAGLGLQLEGIFGGPQDVEWAIDSGGNIAILQSRPITAIVAPRSVLWSNANVNENFPEPISPLLYSIASQGYYHYFRNLGFAFGISRRRIAAMEAALRGIVGVHGARLYYNLTNIHGVLRSAPFGDRLAAAFNRFVGVDEMAPQAPGTPPWSTGGSARQALELVRIAAFTGWQYAFLGRRLRAFERAADAFASSTTAAALDRAAPPDLNRLFLRFLDIRCHRWTNASLCDAAAMVTFAAFERLMAGAGFDPAVSTRLLRALPGVPSSQPPRELWRLSRGIRDIPELDTRFRSAASADTLLRDIRTEARFAPFRAALDHYLDTWGFRSSCELMLTSPTLQERPGPVLELLRQYVRSGGESPESVMDAQALDVRARDPSGRAHAAPAGAASSCRGVVAPALDPARHRLPRAGPAQAGAALHPMPARRPRHRPRAGSERATSSARTMCSCSRRKKSTS